MENNKASQHSIKEWLTFWLLFAAYFFTGSFVILDVFIFKPVLFPLFLIIFFALLFLIGFALRLLAIHQLGKYHSIHIKIDKNHQIIQTGVYRLLRHPMYLSNLMIFVGGAGMFSSLYGIFGALFLVLPATVVRLFREEYFLCEKFGETYKKYMKKTKRILPYLW